MTQTSTMCANDAQYGRVYRIVERAVHPDDFPSTPDPRVAQAAVEIFRILGIWSTPDSDRRR